VFCEGVQHHLLFSLDHFNRVKMAEFQFYLQSGKQRKVGWVGDDSHIVFGQKFPGEEGSVRQCIVMQLLDLDSPKVGGESSNIVALSLAIN
jgi:hypothetical protein